ncbi:SDR family NAD(P)-dependent oxidoreductase [Pedobacter xixiisoli]|uniref:Short chain dehydrogenase n=1 Tax=Pedobacter xixiisoli TaxID=1476464 RepID=A0A285ZS41_9SPHI|nr:SDR family NAD(P)-dependent oxidoreductase [Pedobacter xixiisoli]SOD12459.1 short chain dehydrogenase [Pedobacter xixiisoli]
MKKNIIIIGAGPNLSWGVAEKFAAHNFNIGLISRSEVKLKSQVENLKSMGIQAMYARADAYHTGELEMAISKLASELGSVDVLFYNAAAMKYKNIIEEETEDLVNDFKITVANAFHAVKTVYQQLKEANGAVLITGGGLAIHPNPKVGSLSLGKAALRNLSFQLHDVLRSEEIYVGTLTVNNAIQPDSDTHSPRILANKFWNMYLERAVKEIQY